MIEENATAGNSYGRDSDGVEPNVARLSNSPILVLLNFSYSQFLLDCQTVLFVYLSSREADWTVGKFHEKKKKYIFLGGYGLSLNTFCIASMTLRHASVRSVSWQNRLPVSAKLLLLP